MTTQELMDMPYAGMAERQLRNQNQWKLTTKEAIGKSLGDLEYALEQAQNAAYEIEKQWSEME